MRVRRLSLALALAALPTAACNCDIPFDTEIEGSVSIPLGSDDDCAFDDDVELDAEGRATSSGEHGAALYHYEPDGAERCVIVVDEWRGAMADLDETGEEIDAEIQAAGLDPANATLSLTEVELADVSLVLRTAGGEAFDLNRVGAYAASVDAIVDGDRVPEVVALAYAGGGDPLSPTVETTSDHAGLAGAVQHALDDEADLGGEGVADVDLAIADLPDLTAEGTGEPQLEVSYKLRILGFLSVGL